MLAGPTLLSSQSGHTHTCCHRDVFQSPFKRRSLFRLCATYFHPAEHEPDRNNRERVQSPSNEAGDEMLQNTWRPQG